MHIPADEWWSWSNLDRARFRKYGITPSDYQTLEQLQGGRCAICKSLSGWNKSSKLVIDHCHRRGIVRGLLCGRCNIAIGLLQDSPEVIENARFYVERT